MAGLTVIALAGASGVFAMPGGGQGHGQFGPRPGFVPHHGFRHHGFEGHRHFRSLGSVFFDGPLWGPPIASSAPLDVAPSPPAYRDQGELLVLLQGPARLLP